MKYYVITLVFNPINVFSKEVCSTVINMYKADRQEHNKFQRKLVFKNNEDYQDFQIIYHTLEELGDGVLRALTIGGCTVYIGFSKDTPNKALAKIHSQILREYGNTHPMALLIPNMIRRLAKPFSVLTNGNDNVYVVAYIFNEDHENKIIFSTRKLLRYKPTLPPRFEP